MCTMHAWVKLLCGEMKIVTCVIEPEREQLCGPTTMQMKAAEHHKSNEVHSIEVTSLS